MADIVKIKNPEEQSLSKYVYQNTYGNSIVPISERKVNDKVPENIVDFLKRRDRFPVVGDVIYHDSPYGKNFLKIIRIEEVENTDKNGEKYTFKKYFHQSYSFTNKTWEEEGSREYITENTIKEYYTLVLENFDELIEKAELVHSGEETDLLSLLDLSEKDMMDESNQSSETSLATTKLSKLELVSMMDRCALIRNKAGEVMACVKGLILAETNRMEAIKKRLDSQIAIFSKQIREIMKVIQMIELYCGINEELLQITEGNTASSDEPLVIRQMILFMDEEVAVSNVYANLEEGFDYKDIKKFNKWLVNPQNRDQVIPNKKCIVVMKPRRYTKEYYDSYNPQQVASMNKWNRESYLLIRNGDNLYSIFSDNLTICDKVFPDKAKIKELFEKMANMTEKERNENNYNSTNDLNSIMDRSKSFALMVQGLIDRSDVFKPHSPELSIFKNESGLINFVYDDENILTNGKQLFKDWKKEINETIERGSRIVMMSPSYYGYGRCNGEAMKERFFKWYSDYPPIPSDGIYTLEEKLVEYFDRESQSKKKSPVTFIRYDAGGSYYKFGQGYVDRVKKVSFMINPSDNFILNYDKVSLEDIDYYINSRVDRKEYAWMMPVMKFLRKKTLEEIEKEKDFITMVSHEIFRELGGYISFEKSKELVTEAIQWWKYKVIWKRPINKDDAKAYRMIKEKILRDIKNEKK